MDRGAWRQTRGEREEVDAEFCARPDKNGDYVGLRALIACSNSYKYIDYEELYERHAICLTPNGKLVHTVGQRRNRVTVDGVGARRLSASGRATSETETRLVDRDRPSASARAKCAESKVVTPMSPISPSRRSRTSSCTASSQVGWSNRHQWNGRRSTRSMPSRRSRPAINSALPQ